MSNGVFALQKYLNREEDEEIKQHFLLGGLVDCLLTEEALFEEKYIINNLTPVNRPSNKLGDFAEYYFNALEAGDEEKDAIEEAYKKCNYKRASDTVYKIWDSFKNTPEVQEYYEYLKATSQFKAQIGTKQEVPIAMYQKALEIVNSLRNSPYTSKYLKGLDQVQIYWKFNNQNCKSKLDVLQVDDFNKTLQPVDIKTTSSSLQAFNKSIFKWRYDIQCSFYSAALLHATEYGELQQYKGYKILPFKFVVESTKYPGNPMVFTVDEKSLTSSFEGFTLGGVDYKGWKQLMEDYLWHKENNIWTANRDYIENQGEYSLSW